MASFKHLIFFALAVYAVTAEEVNTEAQLNRVKKSAYVVAAPAPVVSYSSVVPAAYPYSYSSYSNYAYKYPASTYPAYTAATPYVAAAPYAAYRYAGYPSYYADDGKYYPGKYEKTYYPAAYPAYKAGYPLAYHY